MISRRIPQLGLALFVALAVLLVVLYALRQSSRHPSQASALTDSTFAVETAYAPVIPLATITPSPTPDTRPRVLDVATGTIGVLDLGPGFSYEHLMSDGSVLASDGAGKFEAVARNGTVIARFANDGDPALVFSSDNRYALWPTADHVETYDAVTRMVTDARPAGARLPHGFRDGALLLCIIRQCTGTVLTDPTGKVVRTFGGAPDGISASPDEREVAWGASDGMHVYDRVSGAERTYPGVQWMVGALAWAPDGARVAYARLTGDSAVHIRVADLASGAEREVYSGAVNVRLDAIAFTDAGRVTFSIDNGATGVTTPATTYSVNSDGTDGRMVTASGRPWSTCGPACGLPPAEYEDAHGIAFWCQAQTGAKANAGCLAHVVRVDRGSGTVRDLFVAAGPYFFDVSPDGSMLAAMVSEESKTVVHIIQLADYGNRPYDVSESAFFGDVAWFPDGKSVLLFPSSGV